MKETLIGGRYLTLDALGAGGEARVFRARDSATLEDVAVRLALYPVEDQAVPIPPAAHPGWVRHLDSGTDPLQGAYQVFELIKGQTLRQQVTHAPLDAGSWLRFARESLDAVAALHELGWVHGDLNAQNFIQEGATDSRWVLVELPFLRFNRPGKRSSMFGSIHTIAPEQLSGHPADFLSDLYALGCLYYYAAAGEFPHPGASSQEVAIHCLRFDPDPLLAKAPHLPAPFSAWAMTLLARDPQARFPSAAAARQLLKVA